MARQFNEQDLRLLDYESAERKHDEPDEWSVYDAIARAGVGRVMHRFIYLKSRCTQKGAQRAVSYLHAPPPAPAPVKTYVVKSPSLDNQAVLGIFENEKHSPQSHEDLIWQQFSSAFEPYLAHLSETMVLAPHFIAPHLKDSEQRGNKAIPPIRRYMQGRHDKDNGVLRVLSAHAGVGKTTLARHLVRDLVKGHKSSRIVPIFVEAHHWERLILGEIDGLWGTIKNSLDVNDQSYECSRRLSADLFRHALRQGYLSFVFDGFDELCGSDGFDAGQVLQELADMADRESEARILITTRTLFWKARIHAPPENVLMWTLDSFNSQQAHGYFREQFGQNSEKTKHAEGLYNDLRRESQQPPESTGPTRDQFVNLPLCVRMIADLVEGSQTGPVTIPPKSGESFLQRVLRGFCEREIKRISIVSSAEAQLASFVDRAVESDQLNPAFDLEDLVLAVDGIKEVDLDRLDRHALLDRSGSGQYRFRYDFLGPHLRAVATAGWLTDPTGSTPFGTKHLLRVLRGEADGQGYVLEQLLILLDSGDADVIMSRGRELGGDGPVGSLIFHLARELIDRLKLPHEEETRKLFAGLSGVSPENWNGELSGWEFRGTLESLHLAGVKFHRCKFRDVSFRGCVVDRRTKFSECVFDGDLRFERGDVDPLESQWKTVSVASDCKMFGQARFAWSGVLGGGHAASRDKRIADLLRIGLEKFWSRGQIRLMVQSDNWSKGPLGRTGRSEELLRHMEKADLVSIDSRSRIVLAPDSFPDLQNYMDNGQRSGRIQDVYKRLARDDNM